LSPTRAEDTAASSSTRLRTARCQFYTYLV
jgi:hypothetical protein